METVNNDAGRPRPEGTPASVNKPPMSLDKPGSTADGDPEPHDRQRRVYWDSSRDGPMPDWAKPGPADRRPPAPPPRNLPTLSEIRARRDALPSSREYIKAAEATGQDTDKPPAPQDPDRPQPRQADTPDDGSKGTPAAEETESTDEGDAAGRRADKHAERAAELESELADTKAERGKLIETVSRQEARIDRQDAKIDKLESERDEARAEAAAAKAEISRLKGELSRKQDQPAERRTAVDESTGTVPGQDLGEREKTSDRPWYKKRPSQAATELATAGATAVETVGVATHTMSSTAETVVGAFIGLGVAALAYERTKKKEKDERNG